MSAALEQPTPADEVIDSMSARLSKWYGAHAAIRRLWIIDTGPGLAALISLEPTSDGGDALPLWLAMSQEWRRQLRAICERDIELTLVEPDVPASSHGGDDADIVVDIGWRETWIYA